jgi:transcriptional regulator with XRE-family HTH domain
LESVRPQYSKVCQVPEQDAETPALQAVLGTNVRRRRERLGLTQAQAADLAGMTVARWQFIEYGRVNATLSTLARIASALQTDADALLATDPPPEEPALDGTIQLLDALQNKENTATIGSFFVRFVDTEDWAQAPAEAAPMLHSDGSLSSDACLEWLAHRLADGRAAETIGDLRAQYESQVKQHFSDRGVGLALVAEAVLAGYRRGQLVIEPPPDSRLRK